MEEKFYRLLNFLRFTIILPVIIIIISCNKYDLSRTNPFDPESTEYPPNSDLAISNVTFSPQNINIGSNPAAVSFRLTNNGPAGVSYPNTHLLGIFYLSKNSVFGDSDDLQVGTNGYDFTLPANQYKDVNLSQTGLSFISLPTDLAGDFFFFVRIKHETPSILTDHNSGNDYSELLDTIHIGVTDIENSFYKTVKIGTQIWMKENLKVTHYADGTPIELVEDTATWRSLGYSGKAYCWYQNNLNYGQVFGALYTWAAATNNISSYSNPSGIKGVCPDGWHIPSDEEWKQLELFVGLSQTNTENWDIRGTIEGNKLKSTSVWVSGNGNNETGFTALPGGFRILLSSPNQIAFGDMGTYGEWWTSSENSYMGEFAISRELRDLDGAITRLGFNKVNGYSVRCIKD
jgi:uncharacterized protein (TIGR02145 family)